ncbi:hypothetical protein DACRYDRAFT_30394, partial [Dacryopinax primogenitus]
AHLIMLFGDMPAVAKLMHRKGHAGNQPCRFCNISSVCANGHKGIPLDQQSFHSSSSTASAQYDPLNLPLCSHNSILCEAKSVMQAESHAEAEHCAKASGINGISIWQHFGSIIWPTSFPLDFMHLVFENVVPLLLDLWLGVSKHCVEGDTFTLLHAIWTNIAKQVAKSGNTIAGAFGQHVPHLLNKQHEFTAEAYMLWITQLAPVVLLWQFTNEAYYHHLVKLSHFINDCLSFSYHTGFMTMLCKCLAKWVLQYERL